MLYTIQSTESTIQVHYSKNYQELKNGYKSIKFTSCYLIVK